MLKKFNGLKVLVIGDVMIDAYYFGKVERISPEAPVPVVAVENKENRLGGAANVALNLVALGALPTICSVIGQDTEGDTLIELLQQNKIGTTGIVRTKKRNTTVKLRVISQATQMLRIDSEDTNFITETESYELVERIEKLLVNTDVVVLEDYDKGVFTAENINKVVNAAHKLNIPVVVDPKKRNFNQFIGVDLFKPNLKELKEGLKVDFNVEDRAALEEVVKTLMQKMQLRNTMITMSEKGVLITDGKEFHYIPAHYRKIADVSGAGDTVISVAALCFALKLDIKTTAQLANLAGGLVCEEVGVVPIDKVKLQKEAEQLNLV
ncbi:MAG: PfkB family carbohydrate kinase [Bacteroidia bacterium]|nr:PfkB family carbohydrate kinase [Bacteroidia bacterium]